MSDKKAGMSGRRFSRTTTPVPRPPCRTCPQNPIDVRGRPAAVRDRENAESRRAHRGLPSASARALRTRKNEVVVDDAFQIEAEDVLVSDPALSKLPLGKLAIEVAAMSLVSQTSREKTPDHRLHNRGAFPAFLDQGIERLLQPGIEAWLSASPVISRSWSLASLCKGEVTVSASADAARRRKMFGKNTRIASAPRIVLRDLSFEAHGGPTQRHGVAAYVPHITNQRATISGYMSCQASPSNGPGSAKPDSASSIATAVNSLRTCLGFPASSTQAGLSFRGSRRRKAQGRFIQRPFYSLPITWQDIDQIGQTGGQPHQLKDFSIRARRADPCRPI